MMVNYWDAIAVIVQVHDNVNNEDYFINPDAYVINNRWWRHGDMVKQYAHCLKVYYNKKRKGIPLKTNSRYYFHKKKPTLCALVDNEDTFFTCKKAVTFHSS